MIKVGVIGCGAIGSHLVKTILRRYRNQIELVGICEIDRNKITFLQRSLKKKIKTYSIEALIKHCDLVIESAIAEIVPYIVKQAVRQKKDVMILSVAGLLKNPRLLENVQNKKTDVYIPSGAIAGLDALKAARMGKIYSVKLTTKKPLAGLEGAKYIIEKKIDLNKIKDEKILFQGSAKEAVTGFSKNINVAAILSLVGIGSRKTKVCIVASRLVKRNTHSIEIKGDFGKIVTCTENVPSAVNPKTSMLAILSAVATLDAILKDVKIGT